MALPMLGSLVDANRNLAATPLILSFMDSAGFSGGSGALTTGAGAGSTGAVTTGAGVCAGGALTTGAGGGSAPAAR